MILAEEIPVWVTQAACNEPDAPPMFVDQWDTGRKGRAQRSAAVSCCKRCPVRLECGRTALEEFEMGLPLYGMRCGIEFTEVTPCRQEPDVERLRIVVNRLAA